MRELEHPVEFLDTLINTFSKYYWGNNNRQSEAWVGTQYIAQVRFEYHSSAMIYLYINNEFRLCKTYPLESEEGKRIESIINHVYHYLSNNTKFDYQNYYAKVLIRQSEQIINHYFKEIK
jgi:hypothetical protein